MEKISGEETLLSTPIGSTNLTLTTHRVRSDWKIKGGSIVMSITLDAVVFCGLVRKSYPVFLVLAVIAFAVAFAGFFADYPENLGIGISILGLFFLIIYFKTRSVTLDVSSANGSLSFKASGISPDRFSGIIDEIEAAKLRYLGKERVDREPV